MRDYSLLKLIMVDLDGTLFDTRKVNWLAYQDAIKRYGYDIDYKYYCDYCNGRYYLDFLPQITTDDKSVLLDIHNHKKEAYSKYLSEAKINEVLVRLLQIVKGKCKIALVTTASKENTEDILKEFNIDDLFDLVITQENVEKSKPDPEGYRKAMKYYGARADECLIFEDSCVGIQAAERAGVECVVVRGYN